MADLPPKLTPEMALQAQLNAADAVRVINECQGVLEREWATLTRTQVDAQKVLVDLAFRKLLKVLPDKKATDFTVNTDQGKVNFMISRGDVTAKPDEPAKA